MTSGTRYLLGSYVSWLKATFVSRLEVIATIPKQLHMPVRSARTDATAPRLPPTLRTPHESPVNEAWTSSTVSVQQITENSHELTLLPVETFEQEEVIHKLKCGNVGWQYISKCPCGSSPPTRKDTCSERVRYQLVRYQPRLADSAHS
jgi:hypothetical protein